MEFKETGKAVSRIAGRSIENALKNAEEKQKASIVSEENRRFLADGEFVSAIIINAVLKNEKVFNVLNAPAQSAFTRRYGAKAVVFCFKENNPSSNRSNDDPYCVNFLQGEINQCVNYQLGYYLNTQGAPLIAVAGLESKDGYLYTTIIPTVNNGGAYNAVCKSWNDIKKQAQKNNQVQGDITDDEL